jgi:hypothetical protein
MIVRDPDAPEKGLAAERSSFNLGAMVLSSLIFQVVSIDTEPKKCGRDRKR